jgi:hypothetical protein
MTTVDSTATAPPGCIELETTVTKHSAPRPDEKNLFIDIKVDLAKRTASLDCKPPERAGGHKQRKVTFRADKDCELYFDNAAVFNKTWVKLTGGKEEPLNIDDHTGTPTSVGTDCSVWKCDVIPAKVAPTEKGPPKIVVP